MGAVRSRLRRWHIWLGWIVGVPMLLWTLTGVFMVLKPIEEVRGEVLLAEPPAMGFTAPIIPPAVAGLPLKSLTLEPRAGGPRWVITLRDDTIRLADPTSGALLPPYSAADAVREIAARYRGKARIAGVTRTDAAHPPLDLRRPLATWQVKMTDGTRFYLDAASGSVVARRTRWWRIYDLMWGLHIMDLQTREDTHNPWILAFGGAALLTSLLALVLLPMTVKKRRKSRLLDS